MSLILKCNKKCILFHSVSFNSAYLGGSVIWQKLNIICKTMFLSLYNRLKVRTVTIKGAFYIYRVFPSH